MGRIDKKMGDKKIGTPIRLIASLGQAIEEE
ncbi:hypothetical protein BH10PLA2_BH10PLA2_27820 [soil metagenome]